MKLLKSFVLFLSLCVAVQAQTSIDKLLVFNPDQNSVKFNEVYTKNFFYGNFGIKSLVNAVPIVHQNIKTIKISAETEGKKVPNVMELNFDKEGKLIQMKVSEMMSGEAMTIDYVYKEGLIEKEIFKNKEGANANTFHYADGKMIVENLKGMIDVYQLKGNVLYKKSYMDGKQVFADRIDGNCRITTYNQDDIDKICFSNFESKMPFSIEEFVSSTDVKTNKVTLVSDTVWKVEKKPNEIYSFLNGNKEIYRLELDKEAKVKYFDFLGIKSEFKKPIHFTFNYINY